MLSTPNTSTNTDRTAAMSRYRTATTWTTSTTAICTASMPATTTNASPRRIPNTAATTMCTVRAAAMWPSRTAIMSTTSTTAIATPRTTATTTNTDLDATGPPEPVTTIAVVGPCPPGGAGRGRTGVMVTAAPA